MKKLDETDLSCGFVIVIDEVLEALDVRFSESRSVDTDIESSRKSLDVAQSEFRAKCEESSSYNVRDSVE
jgi:hypothetical protein